MSTRIGLANFIRDTHQQRSKRTSSQHRPNQEEGDCADRQAWEDPKLQVGHSPDDRCHTVENKCTTIVKKSTKGCLDILNAAA